MFAEPGATAGTYTIGQVVELLSQEYADITHSSLRFLEREGLIFPDRTPGGHRLFSDAQIERIRRIKTWQRQRLSLEEVRARLAVADQLPGLETVAARLLQLLIDGERLGAHELILTADDAGVPLDTLFNEVIHPVVRETRRRSATGEISNGQEREITSLLSDLIAHLGVRHLPSGRPTGPTVITAFVDGELSELELALVAALLRQRGYVVHTLGQQASPCSLVERIQTREPAAVLFSSACPERLATLEESIAAVRSADEIVRQPLIVVGAMDVALDWHPENPDLATLISAPSPGAFVETLDTFIRSQNSPD